MLGSKGEEVSFSLLSFQILCSPSLYRTSWWIQGLVARPFLTHPDHQQEKVWARRNKGPPNLPPSNHLFLSCRFRAGCQFLGCLQTNVSSGRQAAGDSDLEPRDVDSCSPLTVQRRGLQGGKVIAGARQESTAHVSLNIFDVGHCSSSSESLLYTVGGPVSMSGSNPRVKGFRTSGLQ